MTLREMTSGGFARLQAFMGAWTVAVLYAGCEVGLAEVTDGHLSLRVQLIDNGKLWSSQYRQSLEDFERFPFNFAELGAIKAAHMAELVRAGHGKAKAGGAES